MHRKAVPLALPVRRRWTMPAKVEVTAAPRRTAMPELRLRTMRARRPADAADTALEPGEHRCPVGFLVLETQNKFGAFCEEVKGFAIPAGMESIERACPAGYIVLGRRRTNTSALCEPKEGFPAAPAN